MKHAIWSGSLVRGGMVGALWPSGRGIRARVACGLKHGLWIEGTAFKVFTAARTIQPPLEYLQVGKCNRPLPGPDYNFLPHNSINLEGWMDGFKGYQPLELCEPTVFEILIWN